MLNSFIKAGAWYVGRQIEGLGFTMGINEPSWIITVCHLPFLYSVLALDLKFKDEMFCATGSRRSSYCTGEDISVKEYKASSDLGSDETSGHLMQYTDGVNM